LQTGGVTAALTGQILPDPTDPDNVIALAWCDLVVDPGTNAGANIRYFVNGTAPNRVMVVEYTNLRFLGGTSLKSLTSRQAISRLFWPYKILETTELVRQCFEKQDIAVAVFERQFGLHPEAAKAFIKNISVKHVNLDKKNIQLEAKKLNRYFATISSDYLNQDSIKDLLFE
jgi:hypothetical protein